MSDLLIITGHRVSRSTRPLSTIAMFGNLSSMYGKAIRNTQHSTLLRPGGRTMSSSIIPTVVGAQQSLHGHSLGLP